MVRNHALAPRTRTESGDALLYARNRLKLTQNDFSLRLSAVLGRRVDTTQVAKWERGAHVPRSAVVMAAAQLAGLSVAQLVADGQSLAPETTGSPAPKRTDLEDPRDQLLALVDLGFTLAQAITLVQRDRAPKPAKSAVGWKGAQSP